jgi:hypothetical protein
MLLYNNCIQDPNTGFLYEIRIKRRTRYMLDPKRRAYFEQRFEEERKEREKLMTKDGSQILRTMRFDEAHLKNTIRKILINVPIDYSADIK